MALTQALILWTQAAIIFWNRRRPHRIQAGLGPGPSWQMCDPLSHFFVCCACNFPAFNLTTFSSWWGRTSQTCTIRDRRRKIRSFCPSQRFSLIVADRLLAWWRPKARWIWKTWWPNGLGKCSTTQKPKNSREFRETTCRWQSTGGTCASLTTNLSSKKSQSQKLPKHRHSSKRTSPTPQTKTKNILSRRSVRQRHHVRWRLRMGSQSARRCACRSRHRARCSKRTPVSIASSHSQSSTGKRSRSRSRGLWIASSRCHHITKPSPSWWSPRTKCPASSVSRVRSREKFTSPSQTSKTTTRSCVQ